MALRHVPRAALISIHYLIHSTDAGRVDAYFLVAAPEFLEKLHMHGLTLMPIH